MKNLTVLCLLVMSIVLLCSCNSSQEPTSTTAYATEQLLEPLTTYHDNIEKDIQTSAAVSKENEQQTTASDETQNYDAAVALLMEQLALDMWKPYITLTPFEVPDYVENNAATRLAMRWPDYHLAEIGKYPYRQLVSIDSIDSYIQEGQKPVNGLLTVSGMTEIRYTRVNPSVNGVNVEFFLTIDVTEENLNIVSIDMTFNSNYRKMKEEIEQQANGDEPSIQMIDHVVDSAIKDILL